MWRLTTRGTLKAVLLCAALGAQPALALMSINTATNYDGLSPHVLGLAQKAYAYAKAHANVKKNIVTVVDFTKPSYEKRLWVINLVTHKVLFHGYVAQGKNSGVTYAKHFSNDPGSDESSLGTFVTMNEYDGDHPDSLRLQGLEQGINNNALQRAVVVHPAWYVSPSFIKTHHRAGCSWGCFALNPADASKVVSLIKGGSVLFAYAPQENNDPNLDTA